jgi:hypothetical protein
MQDKATYGTKSQSSGSTEPGIPPQLAVIPPTACDLRSCADRVLPIALMVRWFAARVS